MITYTVSDLDDLAAQFTRMSETKMREADRKSRPAANRHFDNGQHLAYAKCAEMVRALAAPARPRAGIRVVTENGECVG